MLSLYILNGKKPEPQYAVPNLQFVTYYSYVLTCLFFCELRNARFKGKRVSTKKSSVPRRGAGARGGPGGGRARGGGASELHLRVFIVSKIISNFETF